MQSLSAAILPTLEHKGKLPNRSWTRLPPEIIRWIATYCILDASRTFIPPESWCSYSLWDSRMIYTALHLEERLKKLMRICPQWCLALEKHMFWDQACLYLDPYGTFDALRVIFNQASSAPPLRRTAYRHFQRIRDSICIVCRVNHPNSQCTILQNDANRDGVFAPYVGQVFTCKTHGRRNFCGVCLRDSPTIDPRASMEAVLDIGLATNEDQAIFPSIPTTCRRCRSAELWRAMMTSPADQVAVGGGPRKGWAADDLEIRQNIGHYVDLGASTLMHVVCFVREKHWLLKNTRMTDFLKATVAAHYFTDRMEHPEVYGDRRLDEPMADGFGGEDLQEMALPQHKFQARDMAVLDWARTRVLEGHWVSPKDDAGDVKWQHGRSEHPAPWVQKSDDASALLDSHPSRAVLVVPKAPTKALCELLHETFISEFRKILAPAMHNIVRRIALTTADPCAYVASMDAHDVLHELQQPYAWSKVLDVDSLPPLPLPRPRIYKDDASSASSHESHGSETEGTSPVLSSSTLLTTPSPPPREKLEVEAETDVDMPTPRSPTDSDSVPPPRPDNMIHTIPYIPISATRLTPRMTGELQQLWFKMCGPLRACTCSICQRAMRAAQAAEAVEPGAPAAVPAQQLAYPMQIQLTESRYGAEDEEFSEDEDYAEMWEYDTDAEEVEESPEETTAPLQPAARIYERPSLNGNGKRALRYEEEEEASSEEGVRGADATDGLRQTAGQGQARPGTPPRAALVESTPDSPPKRARLAGEYSPTTIQAISPRLVKRRSEDAEEDEMHKRARVDVENAGAGVTLVVGSDAAAGDTGEKAP